MQYQYFDVPDRLTTTHMRETSYLLKEADPVIRAVKRNYESSGRTFRPHMPETVATILNNVQSCIHQYAKNRGCLKADGTLNETTLPADVSGFVNNALEMNTLLVSNSVANEICIVQPMNNRIMDLRWKSYHAGSNKGRVQQGQEFSSALRHTGGPFNYTSEEIDFETIAQAGQTVNSGNLDYHPIRPKSFKIDTGNATLFDDGNGNIICTRAGVLDTNAMHTIDYVSGRFSFTLTTATQGDVTATYAADFNNMPSKLPQADIKLNRVPVMARSRYLISHAGFDAIYDMNRDFGSDLMKDLMASAAAEIRHKELVA